MQFVDENWEDPAWPEAVPGCARAQRAVTLKGASSEAPATGVAYASQTLSNREKTGAGGERPDRGPVCVLITTD